MRTSIVPLLVALGACADPGAGPTTPPDRAVLAPGDTVFYQDAALSPDGAWLALSRLDIHDGYRSWIAVVRPDGSEFRRLTPDEGAMWATWSADGSRVAYASRSDSGSSIVVAALTGGSVTPLTDPSTRDTHPDWSPEGNRIVFISRRMDPAQVFMMNADGSSPVAVTSSPGTKDNPRWSPDGRRITFFGAAVPGADSVYVMSADGTGLRALAAGIWPSFSTDGSEILFVRDRTLYRIPANGGEVRPIAEGVISGRQGPGGRLVLIRETWRAEGGWPAMTDVYVSDGQAETRITGG